MTNILLALSTMLLCDSGGLCKQYEVKEVATTTTVVATTTSSSSTTIASSTSTTIPKLAMWGYFGAYDNNGPTVTEWPKKLTTLLGGPDGQGPIVKNAKQTAAAAGNTAARFLFYLSLGDMDSKCNCFEQRIYESMPASYTLKDASGNKVSTNNGINRVYAMDIGNPQFAGAWTQAVQQEINVHGWDGVLADNVNRCASEAPFWGWSAKPINPRTGQVYTCTQYRKDLGATLRQIKQGLGTKLLYGNHGGAWNANTFSDPLIQQQVLAMDGVQLEDCVFKMDTSTYGVPDWTAQVTYLQFATRNGKVALCEGYGGVLNDQVKRQYLMSTAFLTGAQLGQLNKTTEWRDDYKAAVGRCP